MRPWYLFFTAIFKSLSPDSFLSGDRLPVNPAFWLYLGNKVTCPICTGTFRSFKPYGAVLELTQDHALMSLGRRSNAACPSCGSKERDRAVALYLTRYINWFHTQARSVLHIAPEKSLGIFLRRLPYINYLSGDLSPNRSPQVAMKQIDITKIPFSDNSFDVIICNHVLEHVPDDMSAMRELYRVLKPAGLSILQVPYANDLIGTQEQSLSNAKARLRHYGQTDHVRLYGIDYSDRLRTSGFTVEDLTMSNVFGLKTALRYGLIADEKLFICKK